MAARLNVRMGLASVSKPQYATEASYVSQVKQQMKVLQSDLEYILAQFEDATLDITIEALQPTLDKAKSYTPFRTGDLRNSGFLESVGFRGTPRVELGFARGGVPRYAVLVHEMVEVPHQLPTRSKFLEAAVNEDLGNIVGRLQAGYQRFMGL